MSTEPVKRKRRRGFGLWMLLSLAFFVSVGAGAAVLLSGRAVQSPAWLTEWIEGALSSELGGAGIEIAALRLRVGADWEPVIALEGVELEDRMGVPVADLSNVAITLLPEAILEGRIRPQTLSVSGAFLALRREPDGRFDLALDTANLGSGAATFAQVIDRVDALFDSPALSAVESVRINDVTFQYEDVRAARYWLATGGAVDIDNNSDALELRLGFDLLYGEDEPAGAFFSITSDKASSRATFSVQISELPASDFATQSPAVSWLAVLDAPVSGSIRANIEDDGILGGVDGTLEIAAGALQPSREVPPVGFRTGRAYFSYDPGAERIRFDEFSVSTDAFTLRAEGRAYLRDQVNGWPRSLLIQLGFDQLTGNPDEAFAEPVSFDRGVLDVRLRLDPFSVTIGQAVIVDGESRFLASGDVEAKNDGWHAALDVTLNRISPERLLSLWPPDLVDKTRDWIADNITEGELFDANGAIRVRPGADPSGELGFKFREARVRFLDKMPPVEDGEGYAKIQNERMTIAVEAGHVVAPAGGVLDVAGTVLSLPDIFAKPARLQVSLRAEGEIPTALEILDQPPLEVMTKAEQPTNLATGDVTVKAEIGVDLVKRVMVEDVDYRVDGALSNVASDTLVENRALRAEALTLRATPDVLDISGAGEIDGVPFRAAWTQRMGAEHKGRSRLEGSIELSSRFVDAFGIGLPPDSLDGAAPARIEIDLLRDTPSPFQLSSDLGGLALSLPELGWSKPRGTSGALEVSGMLGEPVTVDDLRLDAAGLSLSGDIRLSDEGVFEALQLERLVVGGWLDAPVVLRARGPGLKPAVEVRGGVLDLRADDFPSGQRGRDGEAPITARIDRLIISDGVELNDMRGDFTSGRGLSGSFSARLNDDAPITGTLVPQTFGTAARIRSDDAGAVARSMGLFKTAEGGDLEMILVPLEAEGVYDAQLNVTNRLRVRDAPALAELLGAISVIGLLEQLSGEGLVFNSAEARFRLTPDQLILSRSSAVGPSLGVSMNGYYQRASKTLDMQGVVSPIYVLNGIGALLTRRGEGLFGFNFTLTGPSSEPSIGVNPLSILTPGMFRELFRRAPPELSR